MHLSTDNYLNHYSFSEPLLTGREKIALGWEILDELGGEKLCNYNV